MIILLGLVRIISFLVVLELVIQEGLLFTNILSKCDPSYLKHGPGSFVDFTSFIGTSGAWISAQV